MAQLMQGGVVRVLVSLAYAGDQAVTELAVKCLHDLLHSTLLLGAAVPHEQCVKDGAMRIIFALAQQHSSDATSVCV